MFFVFVAACFVQPPESEHVYSFTRSQLMATQIVARGRSELLFTWDAENAQPWHRLIRAATPDNQHPVFGFKGNAWWATDRTLGALASFPDIKYVNLAYCCRVTDDGIRQLARLKSLRTLVLYRNHAKYGGNLLPVNSSQASKMPQRLTDNALTHITSFSALESLFIGDNQFSEAAIIGLAKCKSLKYLSIDESQLSTTALAELKRALPKCEINIWSGRE